MISRSRERISESFERQRESRRIRFSGKRRMSATLKPGDCAEIDCMFIENDYEFLSNNKNVEASRNFYSLMQSESKERKYAEDRVEGSSDTELLTSSAPRDDKRGSSEGGVEETPTSGNLETDQPYQRDGRAVVPRAMTVGRRDVEDGELTSSETVGLDVDGDGIARGKDKRTTGGQSARQLVLSRRIPSIGGHWSEDGTELDERDADQGDCRTAGYYRQSAEDDEYKASLEGKQEIPLEKGDPIPFTVNGTRQAGWNKGCTHSSPAGVAEEGQPIQGESGGHQGRAEKRKISVSGTEIMLIDETALETEELEEAETEAKARENREVIMDSLLVKEILSSMTHYFAEPGSEEEKKKVVDLIIEAVMACDLTYGEKAAIEWGDGFGWRKELLEADLQLFEECGLDLTEMARRRLAALKGNRLNRERVARLREDNPERERLEGLCVGMQVPKPDGFVPNGKTSTRGLHKVYQRVYSAVNKMLGDLHDQQLGFVLPESMAREYILHHRMLGKWALKKGKECGRNIGDMSYGEGPYLNGKWAKEAAVELYGEIQHPTIDEIACMIMEFWEQAQADHPGVLWSDMVMWKMDLKGAYTLLDVRPEEVGMFAQELTDGLIYFHLCGVFGWSCTPAAFQVVTRAIKWELKHKLRGLSTIYVDDLVGVCLRFQLEGELSIAGATILDLLGPFSIAEHKTEFGNRLEIIGWNIDLITRRLSIARKNLLKAIHGFFKIDLEKKTKLEEVERIASYSERYSLVCRVMRPFQACFNRMIKEHWNGHDMFVWTEEAKIAIRMWRAALYLVSINEVIYAKPLSSFRESPIRYVIETDGSLSQVGFLIMEVTERGEVCLGGGAASIAGFGFGTDSGLQNTSEFIGAVVGIIALIKMGGRQAGVKLRGDSMTALKWGREEKVTGVAALNAAIVMSTLSVQFGLEINDSEFQSGEENWKTDDLSRAMEKGREVADIMRDIGFPDAPVLDCMGDPEAATLLEACKPGGELESEEEFQKLWRVIREAANGLVIEEAATTL